MTPLHTAARMALDALEKIYDATPIDQTRYDLCKALRSALAAPMPEPVAWIAVADKMPPEDVPCWLYEPGIGAWIGGWSNDGDGWLWHHCHGSQYMCADGDWESTDAEADDYKPTHWMPLPAAPGAAPPAAPSFAQPLRLESPMSKVVLPLPIDLDDWCCHDEDGDKVIMNPAALVAELRARDLEVARVVLEAAAEECDAMWGGRSSMSDAIRELEFHHAE